MLDHLDSLDLVNKIFFFALFDFSGFTMGLIPLPSSIHPSFVLEIMKSWTYTNWAVKCLIGNPNETSNCPPETNWQ